MVGFPQRKSLQGQLQSTVNLFVFLVVMSYNFTINISSQIWQQTTEYGHNMQDDDTRRLLECNLCEWQ